MQDATSRNSNPSAWQWVVPLVLATVAAAFRFYHLDGQLWLDEISALRGYRKPFLETLTTFPAFFPNPLYELLAHAGLLVFGANAWAIRLPAAIFGVAGVVAFYVLARRSGDTRLALLAGALLAASYHHIYFSQDARGYTAYLFFALWSTERLLSLLDRMRWRTVGEYAVLVALATYAHPFGIFVLAGHMLVAFAVAITRQRLGRSQAPRPRQIVALAALSGVAILTIYAPLVIDAVKYSVGEARTAGHGLRVISLLPELLAGLLAGFGGWPVLIAGAVVGLVGAIELVRRQPVLLALLIAPLALSGATILGLGAGVHPRYFLLALPLGYLLAACGVVTIVRFVSARLGRPSWRAEIAVGVVMVVASTLPLARYYTVPKQDYRGAMRDIRELAGNDPYVAAAHAGRAMHLFYDPEFPTAADLAELETFERGGKRVWVMITLEDELSRSDPELYRHLRQNYRRERWLPGTVGDGAMRIYARRSRSDTDSE